MAKAKAPNVTRRDIEEFLSLEEQRKSLNRQAKALEKQAAPLVEKFINFVRANGGKEKSVRRSGHVLSIVTTRGSVQWKPEFIRLAGPEAAEELIQAAPQKESLHIETAA